MKQNQENLLFEKVAPKSKVAPESKVAPKSQYNGYTDARKKANKKWAEKQAQIAIRVAPETKNAIDNHVSLTGESIASFITRSVNEQIRRDIQELDEFPKVAD